MPKSATRTPGGHRLGSQAVGDLHPEAVIAQEHVADARPPARPPLIGASPPASGSTSSGWKNKIPALPGQLLGRRVVVDGHRDVRRSPSTSLEDACHGGGQAVEEEVLGVRPV